MTSLTRVKATQMTLNAEAKLRSERAAHGLGCGTLTVEFEHYPTQVWYEKIGELLVFGCLDFYRGVALGERLTVEMIEQDCLVWRAARPLAVRASATATSVMTWPRPTSSGGRVPAPGA